MIEWEAVYRVVVAMVPLYVPVFLGYGSVKWWHLFTREQCNAINRLVCYFTMPMLAFEFTSHVDPFAMNYRFMGADVIAKCITVLVIAFWAKCSSNGSYSWSITSYSLSSLSNTLIIGAPLLKAMYGQMGEDLAVQAALLQYTVWSRILLFVLEFRRTSSVLSREPRKDLEGDEHVVVVSIPPSFCHLTKVACWKLVQNPNFVACVLGLAWAFPSSRWHLKMPRIIEGSILIMSQAGIGTAMFSLGLFVALQKNLIACGVSLTAFGMVLRFIAAPGVMAIAAIAVGLRGDVLRIAIIQAAMPQSVVTFVFAREYGLHAEVISTALIFGTMAALPILITYFAILELLH